MRMRWTRAKTVLLVGALFVPAALLAYGVAIHDLLPPAALGDYQWAGVTVARDTLPGVTDADLIRFRLWLYDRARALRDTTVRRRFLARYPTPVAFDERAFREFLMLNAAARVLGVDSFGAVQRMMNPADRAADRHTPYASGSRIALTDALSIGSTYPDLDRRNQARLLRNAADEPVRTSRGDSVPFDPATLNMGSLTGLSSQAHAHYGLNRHPKSADHATLRSAPWNFAIATGFEGPVETWAADNAQICSDLAILAARWDSRAGRTLSAFWAGGAMHYIADVGNAVHTVQVGSYGILVDATIQAWLRNAGSLFGLFGTPPSRDRIGLDILTNLHTLSERLYQSELLEARTQDRAGMSVRPSMHFALRALATGDDSLAAALTDTLALLMPVAAPPFGRVIAWKVTDANVRDGAEVYRVTRSIAISRLRAGRLVVDFDTIPDPDLWRFVRVRRGAVIGTELDTFNAVHHRGIARTVSALRAWWREYTRLATPATPAETDAIIARLVTERLQYLDAADERRRSWIETHGGVLKS